MPRFAIPINGQNHVFEGPNADAATRFARQWARDNPRAVNAGPPDYSALGGYVDTFNRAVPGLSEMGAGLAAGGGVLDDLMAGRPADFGAHWTQARAHQQGQIDKLRSDHPIASNMTTGLGIAAPVLAAALATGGTGAAPLVAENAPLGLRATAVRLAANTGRNAFTGAAVGGVYGASQPGTLRQRLSAANQNMLPGAVAGVAAPALVGATRAGLAGVRALTNNPNAIPSALALAGGALQRLPTSEDALYNASLRGIDGVGRPAIYQAPWGAADRLRALPDTFIAKPDSEFAALDRIQDDRTANLSADIRNHFKHNAVGALLDPVLYDDDFEGYTGAQVADLQSNLSNLANHYRPQGENGQVLANEIDHLNANFTAMAGRTQPEFAKAMTSVGANFTDGAPNPIGATNMFERSRILSAAQRLRPRLLDLGASKGKIPPGFDAANFIASAANDDFPLEEDDAQSSEAAPEAISDPSQNASILKFERRPQWEEEKDPNALPDEFKNRFSAEHFIASAANDNLPLGDPPLRAPDGAPSAIADDLAARNEKFRKEVDPEFLKAYDNGDPAERRRLEEALRSLIPTSPRAPLSANVLNFRQRQPDDSSLSPTLENAASRSTPPTGSPNGAPNAFTGASSDMDLAAAIAARTPGTLSDPNYDFSGLKVVLPLSTREQEDIAPPIGQQDQ